jgi:hypothetical protein
MPRIRGEIANAQRTLSQALSDEIADGRTPSRGRQTINCIIAGRPASRSARAAGHFVSFET